jgi:hypothetical protein
MWGPRNGGCDANVAVLSPKTTMPPEFAAQRASDDRHGALPERPTMTSKESIACCHNIFELASQDEPHHTLCCGMPPAHPGAPILPWRGVPMTHNSRQIRKLTLSSLGTWALANGQLEIVLAVSVAIQQEGLQNE